MNNEQILIEAIDNRRLVNFSYENQPIRRAAPHAIYISTAGNKNLDAYQFDGYSQSGNLPDWRNFLLDKIQSLEISTENFEIARGYKSHSPKYNRSIHKI
ncbi:hypothetical protein A2592_01335 [Candidatus Kaiserbacteria bacterium RIFOXYD1_FULL_42_15]|uniref:Uncharacterized protein n=1 Tax=Candidatus Kaiserbacteria bacterium RIFOXYD1_FULL_42_15 TaxID=1798532 RepID=A0A1F6FU33_9BACT|nr:MAG: hypothetical protein A2592_01335 [Candidatus Kaiserbacteria bacterium RIFOXYD1_FULL_42_15]